MTKAQVEKQLDKIKAVGFTIVSLDGERLEVSIKITHLLTDAPLYRNWFDVFADDIAELVKTDTFKEFMAAENELFIKVFYRGGRARAKLTNGHPHGLTCVGDIRLQRQIKILSGKRDLVGILLLYAMSARMIVKSTLIRSNCPRCGKPITSFGVGCKCFPPVIDSLKRYTQLGLSSYCIL